MKRLLAILWLPMITTCQAQQHPSVNPIIQKIKTSDVYKRSLNNISTDKLSPADFIKSHSQKSLNVSTFSSRQVQSAAAINTPRFLIDTLTVLSKTFSLKQLQAGNLIELKTYTYNNILKWLENPPKFTWTSGAIEQPLAMGTILLLLKDAIDKDKTDDQWKYTIQNIQKKASDYIRYSWNNGKQSDHFINLGTADVEESQRMANVGYRVFGLASIAATINDQKAMDTLALIVKNQFITDYNKPGYSPAVLKSDGIIDQHNLGGSQAYNIGYGGDWINDMIRYGLWFDKTRWALTDNEYYKLINALINGNQWFYYKRRAPVNLTGRHSALIIKDNDTPSYMDQRGNINYLTALISSKTSKSYANLIAYKNRLADIDNYNMDSSKYFWNSDILIQSNPNYFVCVKMLSNKTGATETGDKNNGEGLNNYYLGEGSTIIYRTGNEYNLARAVWNWRGIPGTTVKQKTGPLPLIPYGQYSESNNSLAGGVSDGNISIGCFLLDRKNKYTQVKALKSYFAFKDFFICMGSQIKDLENDNSAKIYTTVNQSERHGDIVYALNNSAQQQQITSGDSFDDELNITAPSWFWQDNTGYIIYPSNDGQTKVKLQANVRTGNWQDTDKRNPAKSISVDMFQLSIDHGNNKNWNSRDYKYMVVPNVTKDKFVSFFNLYKNDVKLINNKDQHAVSFHDYYCTLFFNNSNQANISLQGKEYIISGSGASAAIIRQTGEKISVFANNLDDTRLLSSNISIQPIRVVSNKTTAANRRKSGASQMLIIEPPHNAEGRLPSATSFNL